ncbi:MAG: STAS domain-containing protein [Phycisphaerales bacterium]|nr:MAG: STAS domain-containing protein [Phycisphaerales bacterium]
MTEQPSINVTSQDDLLIVAFTESDLIECKYLDRAREEIVRLAAGGPHARIVLDVGNVRYLSSTALGMLVQLIKTIKLSGGELRFANPNEQLADIFEVAHLSRVVEICDSVEEAVARFGG